MLLEEQVTPGAFLLTVSTRNGTGFLFLSQLFWLVAQSRLGAALSSWQAQRGIQLLGQLL